ncbi:MAG: UvrD-helicase domain-containing protein [Rhodospirillaceae bacterium]|jgi:DNA helicase II / ATP-dependent DNA helicase PcrA|nr:UvrD-helicase domain-containing protein [Rhodospirillaceae bacterium]MBT5242648.1 UvrD-helicase domain-containing protein [Rhodospirillaceae bacterium]MBT5562811.1 UvrD-helicase domain-containing protein [Rhodospirillaceae bacterium]MBT6241240.1 UvrD-helicase domain-containing protein [Rhodospirillaceae bacterium]MBT7138049.1 UvrD-helicase domain-containing protein [Rhodospirillaceae bacterium]
MSDSFDLAAEPPPAPSAPAYLDGLNESQRDAVEAVEGPVLVLAGAGTGKTRVLTTRLSHILVQGKAAPWEVLAVTFTNKAAREMQDRVGGLLGRATEGWWIGTFHALGARILRRHAEAVGLKSNFTIIDQDDQVRLLKQLVEAHNIDEKRWPPRVISNLIQRWKDRGLMPDAVGDTEGSDSADGKAVLIYKEYQDRLTTLNAADFGDLLLLCLELFKAQPSILQEYQRKFRYLLVDEYQDTNVAQYLWLRMLAQTHKNICCVGDDDQSIYSWRGAEVGNILRFEKDFPGAKVVRLERNYRSTPHILGAASGLISHNEGRLGKTLWTELNEGEKVGVRGVWDGVEEARIVGDEIEVQQNRGHKLNDMAVLVRAGFQTREFEERLITLGLPYRIIGGARFYERLEIRDAIAYLRVISQPDDDLAFERIVNTPKRGLGDTTIQTINIYARAERIPMIVAVHKLLETDELRARARTTLQELLNDFSRWRTLAAEVNHVDLTRQVLDESGYTVMWKMSKAPEAPGRLENLKELLTAMEDFENLQGFLEHVSLVMENEATTAEDKLTLMTLHGAKGLEFDTVFLPGWEEGLFPHQRALDEGGSSALEEERRLAYVGLTRARKRAMISFAANRRIYGNWQSAIPSRFIDELPPDNVEQSADQGLYGTGGESGNFLDVPRQRSRRTGFSEQPGRWAGPKSSGGGEDAEFLELGQRVFHQKFGYGKILSIDSDKLEIAFEKAGTKKVMAGFVEQT